MAAEVDIAYSHNAPFTANLVMTDENGMAYDFTGSTFKLEVKAADANGNPTGSVLLTLSTGSGIGGTLASGEVQPTFPAQASSGLAPGSYVYDCVREVSSVIVDRVFYGSITVTTGITT